MNNIIITCFGIKKTHSLLPSLTSSSSATSLSFLSFLISFYNCVALVSSLLPSDPVVLLDEDNDDAEEVEEEDEADDDDAPEGVILPLNPLGVDDGTLLRLGV